jgi:cytochrome d ubiquinol oxidase subunit II
MIPIWYAIVAAMLTAWVVLDGFDLGAGIVHYVVARTPDARRTVLAAIGPIWNGNEVWLVASGGVFVFAFPRAYATALSGMYLAFMMVLWLLAFRGIAIEFRGQLSSTLWHEAWDFVFAAASALLAFVAGVALGNIIRGFPLDAGRHFHLDLFAHGWLGGEDSPGAQTRGIVDGYTALVGALSAVTLAAHGATFLAWKTEGDLGAASVKTARRAWIAVLPLVLAVTIATATVRPSMFTALAARVWVWPLPAAALGSVPLVFWFLARGRERHAFLASSAFIASLMLATAAVLFPVLLPSSDDPQRDIDASFAATGPVALGTGLYWWLPAIALGIAYFVNLFRSMRGKTDPDAHH